MGFAVFELKGTGVNTTFMFCMPVLRMCSTTMRRGIAMETGTDGGDIRRIHWCQPGTVQRGGVSTVSVTVHSLARSFHAERDEMRNTQAMRKNGGKQKALAAPPQREQSTTDGNPASSPVADDPHDGRVHSGSSGDDGQYQPVGRVATPASLKPGHTGDPGAARDTSYDPMPSPAEAYANTGQANTEPQREASAEHGLGRTTRRAKDPRVG